MSILQTRSLSCHLGGQVVVDEVSLDARAGEVLTIVGPNGAGKTTILRAMARLIRPARGEVLLDGQSIWSQKPSAVAGRIAFMAQQHAVDLSFTVEEFVALGRVPHRGWFMPLRRVDREVIDRVLKRLDLWSLRHRSVTRLSGGEWQRVRLARSLIQEPTVLLLDEPTSHLDLRFQVMLQQLVQNLAKEDGLAVVVTMHDLNQAGPWSDRVGLLAAGRLVASGSVQEVFTAELLEQVYQLKMEIEKHPKYGTPLISPLPEEPD